MVENDPTNVFVAFEILLEEIEVEIDLIINEGDQALTIRDLESAREAIDLAAQATSIREKVVFLPDGH